MTKFAGSIQIAGVVRESIVDGPGIRFAVFAQGCPHHCEGCQNPATHDFKGGYSCSIDKLIGEIEKNPILSGITFSGGEPFCQAEGFYHLSSKLKEKKLDLLAFTGYTYEELLDIGKDDKYTILLLNNLDFLIDGKFILAERDLTLPFKGSPNQRFIDLNETRKTGEIVELV